MAVLGILGGLLGTILGCGPSAQEIAAARTRYVAAPDGFVVRQEPVAGGGLTQDVDLGLTLRRAAESDDADGEALPGVTVDVDQVDAAGKSKRSWRVWVDTAGLAPGGELRKVQMLEHVDFVPGDGFRIEVRQTIPEVDRAAYREWGDQTGREPAS
jgi:hypothetical protein